MTKRTFGTGYIYHIYNRGIEKRNIFPDESYYSHFLSILKHYLNFDCPYSEFQRRMEQAKTKPGKESVLAWLETNRIDHPVDIISLCLMPNHYHLTLEQKLENGISFYMHKIGLSYTNYFNIRLERTGRLFEGTYKDVLVETDEQLLHLTRYHHINPRKLSFETVEELIKYPWSSFSTYVNGPNPPTFLKPARAINIVQDPEKYKEFVSAEIDEFEPLRLESIAIDDDFGWFRKFRNQKKAQQKEMRARYMERLSEQ